MITARVLGLLLLGGVARGANEMTHLVRLEPVTLGAAATGPESWCAVAQVGERWLINWSGPDRVPLQTTVAFGAREASGPVPAPGAQPPEAKSAGALAITATTTEGTTLILRSGRRVPGVPPRFPSAGVIISRVDGAGQTDLAFVNDVPDLTVGAAALTVAQGRVAAVYLTTGGDGRPICRFVEMSLASVPPRTSAWRRLPDYPQPGGVAGILAGVHGQVLIAAGGANFPERPPWEGGAKVTHDTLYALRPGAGEWEAMGRLPAPRGYAATVSLPQGVLVAGGENGTTIFQDAFFLVWANGQVRVEPAPDLPAPVTSPTAVVLGHEVYVAGGYSPGNPRTSSAGFWRLDLGRVEAGWQREPSWPGPSRAQAVMAAVDGAVYLMSGLELVTGADGKARATYLNDAYRFRPEGGWSRLPDLPWSAVAAPSPAPVSEAPARVYVLGGVDGRQAGKLPRGIRLPDDMLVFDAVTDRWELWPEQWPQPVVTSSAVPFDGGWTIVSGETMAGVRTPEVWTWNLPGSSSPATVTALPQLSP